MPKINSVGWHTYHQRGLRPDGPATLAEGGGAARAVEYDGARTLAEGPVPLHKEVRRRARAFQPTDKVYFKLV